MLAMRNFSLECMACFVTGCKEYLRKEIISGYWLLKMSIKYDPTKKGLIFGVFCIFMH